MKLSSTFSILFVGVLLAVLSLVSIDSSSAYTSGHMPLLTVSESSNKNQTTEYGGTADLYLVIKPGNGRIFIDSFPLSKIDTQITMRFATEVACDFLSKDCSNYDFFYTITAHSAMVGGPSASAAATVLAVTLLDGQDIDNSTVMTGTIDSGNLIGPVAGIDAKTRAANAAGYTKILIPNWNRNNTVIASINHNIGANISNTTYTTNLYNTTNSNIVNSDLLSSKVSSLSIEVIPVSTLEDALYYFTGKNYTVDYFNDASNLGNSAYTKLMSDITIDLCTKYGSTRGNTIVLPNLSVYYPVNLSSLNNSNLSNTSKNSASEDVFVSALNAINNKSYYSAASFCFSGNVKIRTAITKNLSNNDLKLLYARLLGNISLFEEDMSVRFSNISTISKLETYMIVAERLSDSKRILSQMNPENISAAQLAYATERFETARVWSRFSDLDGQQFVMDKDLLKIVCNKKLSEAEERLNYLELYYPDGDLRESLQRAYEYYAREDYPMCIFTSSKVKADSNIVLSAIFIPNDEMDRLFDVKISAAKKAILKQERSDIFPILGYSYFEYAMTLSDKDKYSALLYSEYSLELSNLEMYFKKQDSSVMSFDRLTFEFSDPKIFYTFILGVSLGIFLTILVILLIGRFLFKKNKNSSEKSFSGSRRRK
jgi:predicted S18 family serine protease